jgi:ferredoxin
VHRRGKRGAHASTRTRRRRIEARLCLPCLRICLPTAPRLVCAPSAYARARARELSPRSRRRGRNALIHGGQKRRSHTTERHTHARAHTSSSVSWPQRTHTRWARTDPRTRADAKDRDIRAYSRAYLVAGVVDAAPTYTSDTHQHTLSGTHRHTLSGTHRHTLSGTHRHTLSGTHRHTLSGTHRHTVWQTQTRAHLVVGVVDAAPQQRDHAPPQRRHLPCMYVYVNVRLCVYPRLCVYVCPHACMCMSMHGCACLPATAPAPAKHATPSAEGDLD